MKDAKHRSGVNVVIRTVFGLLVGFAWVLAALLILYIVIVGFLPGLLLTATGMLPMSVTNTADIVVFAGGVSACVACLVGIVLWKILCWTFSFAKKVHKRICSLWHLNNDVEQEDKDMSKKQTDKQKKSLSKRSLLLLIIAVFAVLALAVWGIPKLMNTQSAGDENVDSSTIDAITEDVTSGEIEDVVYKTVSEAGLLDKLNAITLEDWQSVDFNDALDAIEAVVENVQSAESYATDVKIGFDVDGDMESMGNELLDYISIDITAEDIVNLVDDISTSNGVFYDMSFVRSVDDEGNVAWLEQYGYTDVSMMFGDEYVYVTGVSEQYDGAEGFEYVATVTPEAELATMESYRIPADLVLSTMQPALANFSVDTDDVAVYQQENEFGTSYMYRMTEALSRGEYEYRTKTVMMECVGDGEYELTIVYALEGNGNTGILVVNIGTDVTDVVVDIPVAEQVYFIPEGN